MQRKIHFSSLSSNTFESFSRVDQGSNNGCFESSFHFCFLVSVGIYLVSVDISDVFFPMQKVLVYLKGMKPGVFTKCRGTTVPRISNMIVFCGTCLGQYCFLKNKKDKRRIRMQYFCFLVTLAHIDQDTLSEVSLKSSPRLTQKLSIKELTAA